MSASSKKKLRKEQNAALLTERQQQERKEAKKLKIYTTIFAVAMALVVLTAVIVMSVNGVKTSGILQKNTIAAVVGDHEINNVELGYYFGDVISNKYTEWQQQYGDYMNFYMMMEGLDLTAPLNEQAYDEEMTWADHFVGEALKAAKSNYALYDMAMAEGFKLTEEDEANWEAGISQAELYAKFYYGFSDLDSYLEAMYGYGANEKSYREYTRVSAVATAYYNAHADSLKYTGEQISAHEAKNYAAYNSYSFNSYFVDADNYLTGGTTDEKGNKSYSDEERAAAVAEAERIANQLAAATSVDALNKLIEALPVSVGADTSDVADTSDTYTDVLYSALPEDYKAWLSSADRKANDTTVIIDKGSVSENDEEAKETVFGYNVLIYVGCNENTEPIANVRHLLVKFENGTTDEKTGETTYPESSRTAAKEEAEKLLAQWQAGDKTEASFVELVKEHSDDSSAETGGLFEDITPDSNYVETFRSWSVDPARQAGDAEVIESEFGYHVMYYVGDDELSYRQYMIDNDLRTADMEVWYNGIVDKATVIEKNASYLPLDRSVTS